MTASFIRWPSGRKVQSPNCRPYLSSRCPCEVQSCRPSTTHSGNSVNPIRVGCSTRPSRTANLSWPCLSSVLWRKASLVRRPFSRRRTGPDVPHGPCEVARPASGLLPGTRYREPALVITENLFCQVRRAETKPEGSRGHPSVPTVPNEGSRQAPSSTSGGDWDPRSGGDAARVAHPAITRAVMSTKEPCKSFTIHTRVHVSSCSKRPLAQEENCPTTLTGGRQDMHDHLYFAVIYNPTTTVIAHGADKAEAAMRGLARLAQIGLNRGKDLYVGTAEELQDQVGLVVHLAIQRYFGTCFDCGSKLELVGHSGRKCPNCGGRWFSGMD